MSNEFKKNISLSLKLIDILYKQHEALKVQTGALIDSVYESAKYFAPFHEIRQNVKDIYFASFKITSLLDDSRRRLAELRAERPSTDSSKQKPSRVLARHFREHESKSQKPKITFRQNRQSSESKIVPLLENKLIPQSEKKELKRPIFATDTAKKSIFTKKDDFQDPNDLTQPEIKLDKSRNIAAGGLDSLILDELSAHNCILIRLCPEKRQQEGRFNAGAFGGQLRAKHAAN